MMACHAIVESWTFPRLVGAYLDLGIACLLLCCSAFAFFLCKFVGFFGFSIPCPCNGFYGYPTGVPCLKRLFLDCPLDTISSVQLSVKTKFPFDQPQLHLKLFRDDGVLEFQGEASYNSFSDPPSGDSFAEFIIKPRGAATQRPRCGLRRRRRAGIDYGKFTSASSYDHLRSEPRAIRRSPSDSSKLQNVDNSATANCYGSIVLDSESNDASDGSRLLYDNTTLLENLKNSQVDYHGVDGEDENIVRILELALEEERAARVALLSELEQERLAAATAADEAMAMISRLQEEKASVEIEARQYQRILEEKSVYDAEEMDILEEIIVRREREIHFLEKEVEAYRKVFKVNGGWESRSNDTSQQNEVSYLDPSVDPMQILQQLSQSIDNRENIKNMSNYPAYILKQTFTASEDKESSIFPLDDETKIINELKSPECSSIVPDYNDQTNQDIQEKGMLSVDNIPPQLCKSSRSQGKNNNVVLQQVCGADGVKQLSQEPRVHDVHIIESKHSVCKSTDGLHNSASNVERKYEMSCEASHFQEADDSADSSLEVKLQISRSSSDIVDRFSTANISPDRSLVSELRCNSIPAVDHERLKIDNEIDWLRARLRAVQEGKEKLKGSLEHQERAKTELQLLEDITAQLREIRLLTAPEKAARQASLPPLSSKVTSKKRRSRSVTVGVGKSESS